MAKAASTADEVMVAEAASTADEAVLPHQLVLPLVPGVMRRLRPHRVGVSGSTHPAMTHGDR